MAPKSVIMPQGVRVRVPRLLIQNGFVSHDEKSRGINISGSDSFTDKVSPGREVLFNNTKRTGKVVTGELIARLMIGDGISEESINSRKKRLDFGLKVVHPLIDASVVLEGVSKKAGVWV